MSAPLFLPFQKKWIEDEARFTVGMFSRQTGKTFTSTFKIVANCILQEGTTWIIMSRSERQAKEIMEKCVKVHARALRVVISFVNSEFLNGGKEKINVLEAHFANGSRIIAVPANPDTARGFSGNIYLDEFGIHPDADKIWAAMFPIASANNYRVMVTSTPQQNNRLNNHKFYQLVTGDNPAWSRHVVDIYQAVAEGLPRDIDELKTGLDDENSWRREYELAWLDDNEEAWLELKLISAAEHADAGKYDKYTGQPVFIGIDIGLRHDLWVAWVLEPVGDVLWTRDIVVLKKSTFAQQDIELAKLHKKYKVARMCADQTGMGEKPVEDMKRTYGAAMVEGILFNTNTKLMLATTGKKAFEEMKIRIPMGSQELRADLNKLRKQVTPAGSWRFVATQDEQGHADRTWAGFMAIYAATQAPVAFGFDFGKRVRESIRTFTGY